MRALFIIFLILTVLALIPVGVDGGWATGQSVTLGVRVGLIPGLGDCAGALLLLTVGLSLWVFAALLHAVFGSA